SWTIQMSLFIFVGALFALWIALTLLVGLLRRIWYMPAGVRLWAGNRQRMKAREKLVGGLMLLAEGRHKDAEKAVLHRAGAFDMPMLSYLVAAIAAQRQNAWEARDQYLALAEHEGGKRTQVALGVLQGQLQVQAKQWDQALGTLHGVRARAPRNLSALRLLAESALELQDWERLAELLPDLRMQQVFPAAELEAMEVRTAEARLRIAGEQGLEPLEAVWRGLTREQKRLPAVIALYAQSLISVGQAEQAEQLLRKRLDKDWDSRLLAVYAELDIKPAKQVFDVTERWLKDHPHDPDLLYAAGSQALRCELWDNARSYLEAAASGTERPAVLRLLGDLHDRLGESDQARESYRRGLINALGDGAMHPGLPVAKPASLPETTVEPEVLQTTTHDPSVSDLARPSSG
ncbi:MAG: hypothetical protein L0H73_18565, partial [Nitrococcus sp.]|nr:hypothetical protein [Nitrococcus sp.]